MAGNHHAGLTKERILSQGGFMFHLIEGSYKKLQMHRKFSLLRHWMNYKEKEVIVKEFKLINYRRVIEFYRCACSNLSDYFNDDYNNDINNHSRNSFGYRIFPDTALPELINYPSDLKIDLDHTILIPKMFLKDLDYWTTEFKKYTKQMEIFRDYGNYPEMYSTYKLERDLYAGKSVGFKLYFKDLLNTLSIYDGNFNSM